MHIDFILKELQSLFDDSREGLDRITNIIQNLRDFSRVDQAGDFIEYNLNEGIETTLTVARNEIKYDAEVKTELGDIPPVFCNTGQINQVFLNVLVNAAQAISELVEHGSGGMGTITVRTHHDGDYAEIRVEDTGVGIPEEIRAHVFEPFFTTKQVGKGTGQGLAIAHAIVTEKHGGTISFETEPGRGTTFIVRLPISSPSASQQDAPLEELTAVC